MPESHPSHPHLKIGHILIPSSSQKTHRCQLPTCAGKIHSPLRKSHQRRGMGSWLMRTWARSHQFPASLFGQQQHNDSWIRYPWCHHSVPEQIRSEKAKISNFICQMYRSSQLMASFLQKANVPWIQCFPFGTHSKNRRVQFILQSAEPFRAFGSFICRNPWIEK